MAMTKDEVRDLCVRFTFNQDLRQINGQLSAIAADKMADKATIAALKIEYHRNWSESNNETK